MSRLRIGIDLESVGLPFRRGLEEAERLGAAGVQVDAVGNLGPDQLSQTGRRELRHLLRAHNLELTALGCPLRRGLGAPENQESRINHVKKAMALSFDLEARLVIVNAGKVTADAADSELMSEVLRTLGQYGDRIGTTLALATGLDSPEALGAYLDRFDTGSLGVNLDPAGLLLSGFDPVSCVRTLHKRIRHVHARDARVSSARRESQEVPLGHGDIDWMEFLGALEETEYRCWLTIVRQTGDTRLADIQLAVAFLRRLNV
jgi:sugar phosphate isomerase/epimerase